MTLAHRRWVERLVSWLCLGALFAALAPLGWLAVAAARAAAPFDGALARAMVGSLSLVGLAALLGLPVGVFAGVYGAEVAPPRLAAWVRGGVDVLAATPSLLLGVLVHAAVVSIGGGLSLLAGAVALALVIAAPMARATDDLLALVPAELREAGLGIGLPRWRVVAFVALPTAAAGLRSAALSIVARAAGEVAPLLFTAGTSRWLTASVLEPQPSLAMEVFTSASPDPASGGRAFAAGVLLVALVVGGSVAARLSRREASR